MLRNCLALILSSALVFSAPAPARADTDVAAALFGLLFLYGLADALNDNDSPATRARPPAPKVVAPPVRRGVLPASCLKTHQTAEGDRRVAGRLCLQRNDIRIARLPQGCHVRVFTSKGWREGFRPRCLRRKGYVFG